MRHVGRTLWPVSQTESPPKHIPTLLADAIREAGISVAALSRKWAKLTGTKPESKRRLLQKYLSGETVPDEPSARQLGPLLGKPPFYFVTARARVSRRDLDAVWLEIARIYEAMGQLEQALDR